MQSIMSAKTVAAMGEDKTNQRPLRPPLWLAISSSAGSYGPPSWLLPWSCPSFGLPLSVTELSLVLYYQENPTHIVSMDHDSLTQVGVDAERMRVRSRRFLRGRNVRRWRSCERRVAVQSPPERVRARPITPARIDRLERSHSLSSCQSPLLRCRRPKLTSLRSQMNSFSFGKPVPPAGTNHPAPLPPLLPIPPACIRTL